MLAQEFIKGREFTCGVIEKDGEVIPLSFNPFYSSTSIYKTKTLYTEMGFSFTL
jgi:D-alanine-D-alanine ligase-like ATP-grasp enzyme